MKIERGSSNQEGKIDPQNLSKQLWDCLDNIPRNPDDDFVRVSFCDPETFKRRGTSEHKRILCGMVTEIVSQAPVTDAYKAVVVSDFEMLYILGVNSKGEAFSRTGSELRDFKDLVGCDIDGNMAIFSEDGGRWEQCAFMKTVAKYLQFLSATYVYSPNRPIRLKEQLRQWKEEFSAKYQRSPAPHHIYDILGLGV